MSKQSRPRRSREARKPPALLREAAGAAANAGPVSPIDRWDVVAGGTLFVLALAARLAYIAQINAAGLSRYLRLDPLYYHRWAERIAAGDWVGHDVFEMSPLYAYYLGALYRLFGEGQILPRVLQGILGALVCGLLVLVGRRAFSKGEGVAAGLLFALYGPALFYDGQVMKTSMEISFAALATFCFFSASRREGGPAPAWLFTGGLFLGATALMRENILVAAPLFFFWAVWPRAGVPWRGRLLAGGMLFLGTVLPILPATVRNLVVAKETVLITSLGGENFYTGNNEIASGRYTPPPFIRPDPQYEHEDFRQEAARRAGRPLTRREASDFWYGEGLRFIGSHPIRWLALLADKLAVFWNDFERPDNFSFYNFRRFSSFLSLPLPHFAWVAPLGLLGMALSLRRWRELIPLHITLAAFVVSALVFFTQARYRMPVIPILCLFTAHAAAAIFAAFRERRYVTLGLSLGGLALLSTFVLLPAGNTALFEAQNHSLVAEMLLEAGRLDEAAAEYRACIAMIDKLPAAETSPGRRVQAGAHLGLARTLMKKGDDDAALPELALAAESPREDVRFAALGMIGALMLDRGNLKAAAEALKRAVAERPDDFEARMSYAESLDRMGLVKEAGEQLDRAIALRPGDADALRIRGEMARRPGAGR